MAKEAPLDCDGDGCMAALLVWPKKHRLIVMGVDASIIKLDSSCKKLAAPDCEPAMPSSSKHSLKLRIV